MRITRFRPHKEFSLIVANVHERDFLPAVAEVTIHQETDWIASDYFATIAVEARFRISRDGSFEYVPEVYRISGGQADGLTGGRIVTSDDSSDIASRRDSWERNTLEGIKTRARTHRSILLAQVIEDNVGCFALGSLVQPIMDAYLQIFTHQNRALYENLLAMKKEKLMTEAFNPNTENGARAIDKGYANLVLICPHLEG